MECCLAGLLALAGCSYDKSELMGPPKAGCDGAAIGVDGPIDGPGGPGIEAGSLNAHDLARIDEAGAVDGIVGAGGTTGAAGTGGTGGRSGTVGVGGLWGSGGLQGQGGTSGGDAASDLAVDTPLSADTSAGQAETTPMRDAQDAACVPPAAPNSGLSATNANGAIIVAWTAVGGATGYTISRSTSAYGTYAAISTSQTATTYTDPASGLTNGTMYYYKVSASNTNAQCVSAESTTVWARSCIIPDPPIGLDTIRAGNKLVRLVWTGSTNAVVYNVQRSTTSGSGYASVATPSGSPYLDTTVDNGMAYYYVVTAASDAGGNCSSAPSTEASAVPCVSLVRVDGVAEVTHFNTTNAYCVVTCDDIDTWQVFELGTRQLYVNGADRTGQAGYNLPASLLPAKVNEGYAFHFTSGQAADADTGMSWWGGVALNCP